MNRSLTLGVLVLSTAASIGLHTVRDGRPAYTPRHTFPVHQDYRGAFAWLNLVRANANSRQVEPGDALRMGKAVAAYARDQRKVADYQWIEMGPGNVGGRVLGICVDPSDHQKLWAGGASGGLFRSTDSGNTWQHIEAFSVNLMVSSIAILGNGHLYVATGCTWENAGGYGGSGFSGAGIFRSDDDGASFTNPIAVSGLWNPGVDWAKCNRIKADPTNGSRLYIASENPGARLYDESNNTISAFAGIPSTLSAFDVDVSGDGQTVLFSAGSGDAYRSVDGGQNFERLDGAPGPGVGFPTANVDRLELAISPDNGNYMYAIACKSSGGMAGVWSSTDRGENWFRIWPPGDEVPSLDIFRDNAQGHYDNAIAVRPGHPDEVWVGGVELWKTSLNGQPNQLADAANFPGCFSCVHADIHEIVFADEFNAFIGCDGGVYRTPNAGDNFFDCNRDLAITQFYSVGYNAKGNVAGGAQDNGTQFIDGYGLAQHDARSIGGGDGFDVDLSQLDTNIFFTSIYNGAIYRSNDHGNNSGEFYDSNVPVDPNAMFGDGLGDFYTNFRLFENPNDQNSPDSAKKVYSIPVGDTIHPGETRVVEYRGGINSVSQWGQYTNSTGNDLVGPWHSDTLLFPDRITSVFAAGYTTTQGVWVTRDAENFGAVPRWAKAVQNAGGNVSCLEFSADGDALFYGTTEGDVYRVTGFATTYGQSELSVDSADYGLVWTQILSSAGVVTGLAPDPSNTNRLVVTFGLYGSNQKVKLSEDALGAHTFTPIWNVPADLQGMPVYDAVINKDNGNIILVGTEWGIFSTDDAGASWTLQTNGIEHVPVFAMRQQTWNWQNHPYGPGFVTNANVIYAGTHGRGIYRTDDFLGIAPVPGLPTVGISGLVLMPNPASTVSVVSFTLAKQGDVTVNLFDMGGRLVRTITRKHLAAAAQNVAVPLSDIGDGTYVVEVRSGDTRRTGRLVVAR